MNWLWGKQKIVFLCLYKNRQNYNQERYINVFHFTISTSEWRVGNSASKHFYSVRTSSNWNDVTRSELTAVFAVDTASSIVKCTRGGIYVNCRPNTQVHIQNNTLAKSTEVTFSIQSFQPSSTIILLKSLYKRFVLSSNVLTHWMSCEHTYLVKPISQFWRLTFPQICIWCFWLM